MSAPFPASEANDHQIVSRRSMPAPYAENGTRTKGEDVACADIDMRTKRPGALRTSKNTNCEPYL